MVVVHVLEAQSFITHLSSGLGCSVAGVAFVRAGDGGFEGGEAAAVS